MRTGWRIRAKLGLRCVALFNWPSHHVTRLTSKVPLLSPLLSAALSTDDLSFTVDPAAASAFSATLLQGGSAAAAAAAAGSQQGTGGGAGGSRGGAHLEGGAAERGPGSAAADEAQGKAPRSGGGAGVSGGGGGSGDQAQGAGGRSWFGWLLGYSDQAQQGASSSGGGAAASQDGGKDGGAGQGPAEGTTPGAALESAPSGASVATARLQQTLAAQLGPTASGGSASGGSALGSAEPSVGSAIRGPARSGGAAGLVGPVGSGGSVGSAVAPSSPSLVAMLASAASGSAATAKAACRLVAEHAWALLESGHLAALAQLLAAAAFLPGGLAGIMEQHRDSHYAARGCGTHTALELLAALVSVWARRGTAGSVPATFPALSPSLRAFGACDWRASERSTARAGSCCPDPSVLQHTRDVLSSPAMHTRAHTGSGGERAAGVEQR